MFVVIPVAKIDVIDMLLHVFDDGPPCRVVTLLLPELNVVEKDAEVGLEEILKLFEQDDVESKVLEDPNYSLLLFPSSDALIHS